MITWKRAFGFLGPESPVSRQSTFVSKIGVFRFCWTPTLPIFIVFFVFLGLQILKNQFGNIVQISVVTEKHLFFWFVFFPKPQTRKPCSPDKHCFSRSAPLFFFSLSLSHFFSFYLSQSFFVSLSLYLSVSLAFLLCFLLSFSLSFFFAFSFSFLPSVPSSFPSFLSFSLSCLLSFFKRATTQELSKMSLSISLFVFFPYFSKNIALLSFVSSLNLGFVRQHHWCCQGNRQQKTQFLVQVGVCNITFQKLSLFYMCKVIGFWDQSWPKFCRSSKTL